MLLTGCLWFWNNFYWDARLTRDIARQNIENATMVRLYFFGPRVVTPKCGSLFCYFKMVNTLCALLQRIEHISKQINSFLMQKTKFEKNCKNQRDQTLGKFEKNHRGDPWKIKIFRFFSYWEPLLNTFIMFGAYNRPYYPYYIYLTQKNSVLNSKLSWVCSVSARAIFRIFTKI